MLPAPFRLSQKSDIAKVFQKGHYAAFHEFAIKWLENGLETTRIGFLTGKKLFPTAVERNQAKRLARDAVRPHLPQLASGYDIVVMYRHRPNRPQIEESAKSMHFLFQKNNLLKKN
jgi:ribonuclease P protein component